MAEKELTARVAYLKGLAEGMEIPDSKEGKLLKAILDVLEEAAQRLEVLDKDQRELAEYVEEIDDDLSSLQEFVYDLEEDEDEEEEEGEEEETELVGVKCPHCHQTAYFEEELVDDFAQLTCPNCGEEFSVDEDWDYDDDGILVSPGELKREQ